jgi:hypothetical protein
MGFHRVPRFLLLIPFVGLKLLLKGMVAERDRVPWFGLAGWVPRLIMVP